MTKTFNVGDEVTASARSDAGSRTGKVVQVTRKGTIEVDFPGWTGGHSGDSGDYECRSRWFFFFQRPGCGDSVEHLTLVETKPTLADELALKPSTRRVLAHMRKMGDITVLQAIAAYGTARIAPAVYDLRKVGFKVNTVSKVDAAGHKYTSYSLAA